MCKTKIHFEIQGKDNAIMLQMGVTYDSLNYSTFFAFPFSIDMHKNVTRKHEMSVNMNVNHGKLIEA